MIQTLLSICLSLVYFSFFHNIVISIAVDHTVGEKEPFG